MVKLFNTKYSTLKEVEKAVKPVNDVKTDIDSNLEIGSKTNSLLDKDLTCKKCWFQNLSSDQRLTEFMDILDRGWDTLEKWSRDMNKYDYIFTGWLVPDFSPWTGGDSSCLLLGWWESLQSTTCSSRSCKPTFNSGGSSH